MTVLLLVSAIALGAAAYVAVALAAMADGAQAWWFVVGAPVAYAAVPFAFTLAWFGLAWIWRARRPLYARLDLAGILRLFAGEWWAIMLSGPLMVFHRLLMREPPRDATSTPVVLIHGVMCNDGVWFPFKRALARRGLDPVYTLNYGWNGDIDDFADDLERTLDRVLARTGATRVAIVAHSMGGLVTRAYLRRYGHARIERVITLGTPHHGSTHALFFVGRCVAQLRPGSAWLAALNESERAPPPVPFVSLWSWHDNMVAPQTSSMLEHAINVEVVGVGHNALLRDAGVHARVAEWLGLAEAARATSGFPA